MNHIFGRHKRVAILLIFAGFVLSLGAFAQTITYNYDESGNRIQINAAPKPSIEGIYSVCYDGNSFSLSNPPSGTITWTVSGPFSFNAASSVTSTTANTPTVYRTMDAGTTGTLSVSYGGTVIDSKSITACPAPTINSPNTVCYDGSAISVSNPPSTGTLTWTITGPFSFSASSPVTSTNAGQSATLYRTTATGSTSGTLSLRYGNASGTVIASKNITACTAPTINISSTTVCHDGRAISVNNPISGTLTWTVTGPFSFSASSSVTSANAGQSAIVYITSANGGTGKLSLRLGNASDTVLEEKTLTACQSTISGTNPVCHNGSSFTLSNPPSGTVYWSVSNTTNFEVTYSGNPTTVTRKGTGSGDAILYARSGSTTGTIIAQITITPCSTPLPVISGFTGLLCSGQSKSFSATNWQPGYKWVVSSNLTISGSNTGSTVNVTGNSSSNGVGWLKIVSSGNVEIASYNNNIWVGGPTLSISGDITVSQYSSHYYTASVFNSLAGSATQWDWNLSLWNGGYCNGYISGSGSSAYAYFADSGTNWVKVRAKNTCDWGDYSSKGVNVEANRSPSNGIGNPYPNPVSQVLYIEIDPPSTAGKTQITYDLRLLDGMGNLLRQTSTNGGTVQFNVSSLPDGIYYLHIYSGITPIPEMHQIVVEH